MFLQDWVQDLIHQAFLLQNYFQGKNILYTDLRKIIALYATYRQENNSEKEKLQECYAKNIKEKSKFRELKEACKKEAGESLTYNKSYTYLCPTKRTLLQENTCKS